MVSIDSLSNLDGNPRKGNIDAIAASYKEFGQVKPIVAKKNEDGTSTVIAGNHQLMAAKKLGWEKIACIFLEGDDKRAIAFALADNRTMELGHTDDDLLHQMLVDVSSDYGALWDNLGWDEFELAGFDEKTTRKEINSLNGDYYTPTIVDLSASELMDKTNEELKNLVKTDKDDGKSKIMADDSLDQTEISIKGSTVALPNSAPQAIVQYTVVFDNPQQQAKWYDFVRWLRSNPSIDGNTTAERLMNFIDEHCEI
jgi:ParB-like chromosome segregation protein Spo0J